MEVSLTTVCCCPSFAFHKYGSFWVRVKLTEIFFFIELNKNLFRSFSKIFVQLDSDKMLSVMEVRFVIFSRVTFFAF